MQLAVLDLWLPADMSCRMQDDTLARKAFKEAEEKLRQNDLDGASVAIAKAEQLEYELAKRRRRLLHGAPRLSRELEAEAEAALKAGDLEAAETATTRASQLIRWQSNS